MASRRRKVRRSIEATCPTCHQAVTAAGCFDGDPTPEQLAGFEEIALAVHAKVGCPGPPP